MSKDAALLDRPVSREQVQSLANADALAAFSLAASGEGRRCE